jgi:geranylgeranyl diphosphate synthase, type II
MTSSASFKEYYARKLELFENHLKQTFPKLPVEVKNLEESMRYSLFAGGKRLRPVLIMTTAESGGLDPEIVLPFACAAEYIHTYSLIHDDLPCMDDDQLRRGKPTNHIQFGEAIALLAGDALLTHSFSLVTSASSSLIDERNQLRIINILAEKAGVFGMVSGQVADINGSECNDQSGMLNFIHRHKTGALITACVQIGALLADYQENKLQLLTRFGEEIGKCFQIQDDILDETGDKSKLGKNPGTDIKNDTLTYPRIYGLEQSKKLADQSYQKAIESLDGIGEDVTRLRQLAGFILKRDH